jgi:hypothetical protein
MSLPSHPQCFHHRNNIWWREQHVSPKSSVSVAAGPQNVLAGFRFLAGGKWFFVLHDVRTGPGAHAAPIQWIPRGHFPRGKVTTLSTDEIKNTWSHTSNLLFLYSLVCN